jgi:hypothetical protein
MQSVIQFQTQSQIYDMLMNNTPERTMFIDENNELVYQAILNSKPLTMLLVIVFIFICMDLSNFVFPISAIVHI